MLHSQREFDLSLKFLERALNVHLKFYGAESLQTGTVFHLVARAQCCIGDYRAAVTSEKATYNVYKKLFGEENARTKESSEFLNQTTHRAVKMQKTVGRLHFFLIWGALLCFTMLFLYLYEVNCKYMDEWLLFYRSSCCLSFLSFRLSVYVL